MFAKTAFRGYAAVFVLLLAAAGFAIPFFAHEGAYACQESGQRQSCGAAANPLARTLAEPSHGVDGGIAAGLTPCAADGEREEDPLSADDGQEPEGREGDEDQSGREVCLTAVLYSDGELIIRAKAPSQDDRSQDSGDSEGGSGDTQGDGDGDGAGEDGEGNRADRQYGQEPGEGGASGPLNDGAADPGSDSRAILASYSDFGFGQGEGIHAAPWYERRGAIRRVTVSRGVCPTTMAHWFDGLCELRAVDLAGLDTSRVSDMQSLFNECSQLGDLDVSGFDTAEVTNMARMFANCSSLTRLDLSGFKTGKVADMSGMFANCSSMKSLDLSGFDTCNVTAADDMLGGCSSLSSLDVSGFSAELLSAAALPVENEGGFWKLNVPDGYDPGVALRAPTAEERAAAGLADGSGAETGSGAGDGTESEGSGSVDASATTSARSAETAVAAVAAVTAGLVQSPEQAQATDGLSVATAALVAGLAEEAPATGSLAEVVNAEAALAVVASTLAAAQSAAGDLVDLLVASNLSASVPGVVTAMFAAIPASPFAMAMAAAGMAMAAALLLLVFLKMA